MVSYVSDDIFWAGDGQWEAFSQRKYLSVYRFQEEILLIISVAAKKFYEKEAEDAINEVVEEVDLFDDEDDEEFGSDGEWEWK